MITASMAATAAAVRMAAASSTRRWPRSSIFSADIAAATSSGVAVARASNWSTAGASALELDEFLRIEGAEPLVRLDGEGQQQRGHGRLHDHVGQGQRLDHGVHRRRVHRYVGEVRGGRAALVAHSQQQHIGGGLDNDQAYDLMHQVAAGDYAVETGGQYPRHDHEREELHHRLSCRTRSVCSSSLLTIKMKAAATSMPTKKLMRAMVPDELTAPGVLPSGRKLDRYGKPMAIALTPRAAKPPAPAAPAASVISTGLIRLKTRNSPAR